FIDKFLLEWTGGGPGDFRVPIYAQSGGVDCVPGEPSVSCANRDPARLAAAGSACHALAHVPTLRAGGATAPSLADGTAEAFGSGDIFKVSPREVQNIEPSFMFADDDAFTAAEYLPARLWTSFLIRRYGTSAFREYYRRMGKARGPRVSDF